MTKIIFGVFAHPDDEAFGPSGYFVQQVHDGAELHLTTLTLGDAGANPDNHNDLAIVREHEWRRGGALIGATKMHFLGYLDGKLNNQDLIDAGQKIYKIIATRLKTAPEDAEVEVVTSDLNGISGHIDHIVAARAATWAYYRLKDSDSRIKRIKYSCIPREMAPKANTEWLYMEAGRTDDEINETVDARHYQDEIIAIMRTHHTQREDGEAHISQRGDDLGLYYFVVTH